MRFHLALLEQGQLLSEEQILSRHGDTDSSEARHEPGNTVAWGRQIAGHLIQTGRYSL